MIAYCGRLLRALATEPGRGPAAPHVRRSRRSSASFRDRFPYRDSCYAREAIAERCSMRPAGYALSQAGQGSAREQFVRRTRRTPCYADPESDGRDGVAADEAPTAVALATALIGQTGSRA